jgi:iron complex outermembrane receptor protein
VHTSTHITRSFRIKLMATVAVSTIMAVPAIAQEGQQAKPVEKVTVTGSRIKTRDFKSISPIATIGAKDIALTGAVNVESLLNELPQVVPGLTVTSNNPSLNGFATADLRGLGPGRTLVLINGRRANPSDRSGAVDLNTIPTALVDRIELITGGASAVYGADAVAGAINFIMKDDFEGVQLSASRSQAEDGAAPATTVDGVIGGTFEGGRGSLMAGFQYYSRQPVGAEERDWSRNTRAVAFDAAGNTFVTTSQAAYNAGAFNPAGSGTAPWATVTGGFSGANIATASGQSLDADCNAANGVQLPTSIRFNAAGGIEGFQNCGIDSNNNQSGPSSLGDRYDFAPDNLLLLENERVNGAVFGKYDIIADGVLTAFVESSFTNSRSKQQLAATPVTGLTVRVDLDPAVGSTVINPYVSANTQLLNLLNLQYPAGLDGRTLGMSIRPNQGGLREGIAESNAISVTTGLRGTVPSIDWDWEVFYGFARNSTSIFSNNNVGKTAITQLINACGVTSNAVQAAPLTALPNCPFPNLLGSTFTPTGTANNPLGLNSMNAAQLAFINVDSTDVTIYERNTVGANATGDLVDLWGEGPIAAAIGVEYRAEALDSRADPFKAAGDIFGFNAQESISGEYDVYEAYGEVQVPLITGEMMFENLSITGGYRTSQYSTGAGIQETWKYGAEWSPVNWLTLRAVENHAVRAPTAFELFQAGDQNFPGYGDPCNNTAVAALSGATQATRIAACTAWFASGGATYTFPSTFAQINSQVEAFQIGTPGLKPEIADTLTYGVVFNPDWWPAGRLLVSADRWEIEIAQPIALRSIANILNGCLTAGGASIPGNDCTLAPRQSDGQIDFVNQTRSNGTSYLSAQGVDVNLRWALDLDDTVGLPGTFGIATLYTWTDNWQSINPAVFPATISESVNTHDGGIGGGTPEHKASTNFTYQVDDLNFLLRWTYSSAMEQASFGTEEVEAYNLYEFGSTWDINGNLMLSFGVKNIFDKQPQMFTDAQIFGQYQVDGSAQDQLGRSYRLGLTWKN